MSSVGQESWTTEKLNDRAYAAIKEKIISHELEPGARLVDSQLAERYGISRTPVRDAIRKLAEEGLVVTSDKKGYFVFKPTRQDIMEIYELRLVLDQAVVRKLVTQMFPGDCERCMAELERIEATLRRKIVESPDEFTTYDEEFHDGIARMANNSRLAGIYADNRTQCRGFRLQTSMDEARMAKANRMHFKLLEAIKRLDLDGALKAVEEHVEMSRVDAIADFMQWEHRTGGE